MRIDGCSTQSVVSHSLPLELLFPIPPISVFLWRRYSFPTDLFALATLFILRALTCNDCFFGLHETELGLLLALLRLEKV